MLAISACVLRPPKLPEKPDFLLFIGKSVGESENTFLNVWKF
jgi:hypothetical protein